MEPYLTPSSSHDPSAIQTMTLLLPESAALQVCQQEDTC